jgi:hypothetical protein
MQGQFDEPISEAAGARPFVVNTRAAAERLERNPKGRPADRVEAAAKGQAAVLTLGELEIPRVDHADVLGEHRRGLVGVPSMRAIEAEAAHPSARERVRAGDARSKFPPVRLSARPVPASKVRAPLPWVVTARRV